MNITLSQDTFYNLNVNENIVLADIIKYYFYLIGYLGVSTSCIYAIMKISNFVDGFFEYTETGAGVGDGTVREEEIPYEQKWFDEFDDGDGDGDDAGEQELTEEFVNNLALNTIKEIVQVLVHLCIILQRKRFRINI